MRNDNLRDLASGRLERYYCGLPVSSYQQESFDLRRGRQGEVLAITKPLSGHLMIGQLAA